MGLTVAHRFLKRREEVRFTEVREQAEAFIVSLAASFISAKHTSGGQGVIELVEASAVRRR